MSVVEERAGRRRLLALPAWRSAGRAAVLMLSVSFGWSSPPVDAQVGASGPSPVASITLERNCFGCDGAFVLTLRSDGAATYTLSGNARQGTADVRSSGRVSPQDVAALVRVASDAGFFEMQDAYDDPSLRDGPSSTIEVVRGDRRKRVFRRDDAGPDGLKAIEAAIESTRARISFVRDTR